MGLTVPLSEPAVEVGENMDARLVRMPRRIWLPGGKAAWIRPLGQALLVLTIVGLLLGEISSPRKMLGAAAFFSAIWFGSLQGALSNSRLVHLPIGRSGALLTGTITGLFAVSTASLWIPGLRVHPGRVFVIAACILLLSSAWQIFADRVLVRPRRVLVVGAGGATADLVEHLAAADDGRFEIVAIVEEEPKIDEMAGIPVYGRLASLAGLVRTTRPDLVVIGVEHGRPEVFRQLLEAGRSGFTVGGLPEFYEHAFGRVPVRHLTHAWFMSVFHLYQRSRPRFVKRAFDLAVASTALLITAPLLVLVALITRLGPNPMLYRQTRLGEGGRHFTIYKLRTMCVGAEAPAEPRWATENDPRVTRLGRLLRRTRIDELPQLWNVLRGDMSIVGPRPERPEFLELLVETVPFWTQRHLLLRPGITGWAQIRSGYSANVTDTELKLSYDLWYLRHQSLLVDLMICVKTFPTLVRGTGAR